jgi:hypothetical protein
MIPHELRPRNIKLPETDNHTIVLITGNEIRHERFALRIQKEFGDMVLAWYQVVPNTKPANVMSRKEQITALWEKIKELTLVQLSVKDIKFADIVSHIRRQGLIKSVKISANLGWNLIDMIYWLQKTKGKQQACEKKLFMEEITELRQIARLKPEIVNNPNSKEFVDTIRTLNPYFFLSLSGALYGKELLSNIRGISINQHAGWSPVLRGSGTFQWALYQRNLDYLGNTVHITTTGVDAGPILRRSQPCLIDNDTPESCLARVVALGTELMIEVVKDIQKNKEITIYDQPDDIGKTYLGSQMEWTIRKAIYRDFQHKWLQEELSRLRRF